MKTKFPITSLAAGAAFTIAALAFSSSTSNAETPAAQPAAAPPETITPAQWLQRQIKPVFKEGHTMPRLTRFGWSLGLDANIALTEDWHYALQLPTYLSDDDRVLERLEDPNDEVFKIVALTNSNPEKYPLATIISRSEPADQVPEAFLHDADGKLVNNEKIYSPVAPQTAYDKMAEMRARPLRELRKKVPINIVLNGGEYGLGVLGFMRQHAEKDPKVQAALKSEEFNGDWFALLSKAKGRERLMISAAVREAVPDRSLYIYYHSGNVERNRFGGWTDWGYDNTYSLDVGDLPSNEHYHKHFNSGYLPDGDGNDMLTRALNAVGFHIAHNQKNSYDWLSGGWVDGATEDAGLTVAQKAPANDGPAVPELQGSNVAALVDPNAGQLSPMPLYTGFLKCLFTTGTLGANAGYYALPTGGFEAPFPAGKPRQWAMQMTRLSHVQALFSYFEDDLRQGDLLKGDGQHGWTRDQPSYEFSSSEPNVRIVARKTTIDGNSRWLVTAWAADGLTRPTKVTIPELGELTMLARPEGSVYRVTLKGGKPQLLWLDPNGMMPTVPIKPRQVTTEQIHAQWKGPVQPALENLQLHFDAAQGIAKGNAKTVLSWKPKGALADWEVTSSLEGKLPAYADRRPPVWVADAVNGLPALRFSGNGASLMSAKLKPEAGLEEATMTVFAVFASSVPQEDMSQSGANNSIFRVSSGSGMSNGPWPDATKQTWQMRMAVEGFKGIPEHIVVGSGFWGAEHIAGGFFFSGDIAEILVYSGNLSPAQQAQTRLYLQNKYRL